MHEHHSGHAHPSPKGSHMSHGASHHTHMIADFRRRFWISLALTLPILALAPVIQRFLGVTEAWTFVGDRYAQFGLATVVFFYGGWPFLTGAIAEFRRRNPGMMTLIALAIVIAYGYSSAVAFGLPGVVFFWELATLIDVMLLGHWVEMRSVLGASGALERLIKLLPAQAHRFRADGSIEEIAVTELHRGDRVLVKPGERIPSDGVVVEGETSVNEALLTGESMPVEKRTTDSVIGGAVNGGAAITVEITKTGEETYLAQVVGMVRRAQASRSRTQDLANRAARWLTMIALTAGGTTLVAWLIVGRGVAFSVERMVTVMVITCPHALGLAIPLVVAVSTALGARRGLLIRDRTAFERARKLDAIVFDKTGTLTEGRFGVTDVVPLNSYSKEEILRLAGSLESRSEHPIATGIVQMARELNLRELPVEAFEAIPGRGAKAVVDGKVIEVVSPQYLEEQNLSGGRGGSIADLASEGKTLVYVLIEDRIVGVIALADVIRQSSREALHRLKTMGIQMMMLTGDSHAVARWVAEELELDDFFAEVLPDQKATRIREIKARGLTVAMVGDGVNDAPALVEADVGIAIGTGTDIAVEAADIVLVRSDPRDVAVLVQLARSTYGKMIQNLGWATGYNAVAIPLAGGVLYHAGFVLSPAVGAVLMSLSTVIVAINARLLGRFKSA